MTMVHRQHPVDTRGGPLYLELEHVAGRPRYASSRQAHIIGFSYAGGLPQVLPRLSRVLRPDTGLHVVSPGRRRRFGGRAPTADIGVLVWHLADSIEGMSTGASCCSGSAWMVF